MLPIFLLLVLGAWAGMFAVWPEVVNPKALAGATAVGAVRCDDGSLSTYATGATILTNIVFLLAAVIVVLRIGWSSSERRYLRLIDKLEKEVPVAAPASSPISPLP